MSKMSTMFRPVIYGPCSRTGVTCVAADVGVGTGVGDHCQATGHSVSMKDTKVLTRESNWHKRKVKEAIYIRQRAPTMNRDLGIPSTCHLQSNYPAEI